jgi:hypothetical protein
MRCDARNTNCLSIPPEHLPYDLLSQAFAQRAKQVGVHQAGREGPRVNRNLRQGGHRDRADASMLTNEVDDAPAVIALPDMCESERRDFRPPQAAAEKNS